MVPALHARDALFLRGWRPWLNHTPTPGPTGFTTRRLAAQAMFSCASPRRSRPSTTGSAPPRGTIQRSRSGGLRRSHSSAKQLCDADDQQHENMYTDKSPRPGGGDGREALSPLAVNSPDTMPLSESVVRTARTYQHT